MRTALGLYLEACETSGVSSLVAKEWLDQIPAWQIAAGWEDFAPRCPARVTQALERRPANAINVEIGDPLPRCLERRPSNWRADTSSLRWVASGGSVLVFDPCERAACPRAKGAA